MSHPKTHLAFSVDRFRPFLQRREEDLLLLGEEGGFGALPCGSFHRRYRTLSTGNESGGARRSSDHLAGDSFLLRGCHGFSFYRCRLFRFVLENSSCCDKHKGTPCRWCFPLQFGSRQFFQVHHGGVFVSTVAGRHTPSPSWRTLRRSERKDKAA